jgi:hypothetical protein
MDKAAEEWSWQRNSTERGGQEWWIYTSTSPYTFMGWC